MQSRARRAAREIATVGAVLLAAGLVSQKADAKISFDSPYTLAQTYNAALRLVRVDLGLKITEKDPGAAYVMFDYRSPESGGHSQPRLGRNGGVGPLRESRGSARPRCRATTSRCSRTRWARSYATSTASRRRDPPPFHETRDAGSDDERRHRALALASAPTSWCARPLRSAIRSTKAGLDPSAKRR